MQVREAAFILIGFAVSTAIIFGLLFFDRELGNRLSVSQPKPKNFMKFPRQSQPYDESLAGELFDKVTVLCLVLTHPAHHLTKAMQVKNTWGRRCNKLLFVSSEQDDRLGEIISSPGTESRGRLWAKVRDAFKFAYENHIEEFDWFLKADDDRFGNSKIPCEFYVWRIFFSYVIAENLRNLLSQYNPNTSLLLGHRYASQWVDEGYMAGGGYILSNKALRKFVEELLPSSVCHSGNGSEDLEIGRCLAHSAIFIDCRDELKQKRFFPNREGIELYTAPTIDPENYFKMYEYYTTPQGSLNCCSDVPVMFHYVNQSRMQLLENLIYKTYPFGINQPRDSMPHKLSLKEIIAASDVESSGRHFVKHKLYHDTDESELY